MPCRREPLRASPWFSLPLLCPLRRAGEINYALVQLHRFRIPIRRRRNDSFYLRPRGLYILEQRLRQSARGLRLVTPYYRRPGMLELGYLVKEPRPREYADVRILFTRRVDDAEAHFRVRHRNDEILRRGYTGGFQYLAPPSGPVPLEVI